MKAAIITTHTVPNYGAVLQTYATQEIFRQYGFETEVIDYWRPSNKPGVMFRAGLGQSKFWSRNMLSKFGYHVFGYPVYRIKRRFRDSFIKKNIKLTHQIYYSEEELEKNIPEADLYITGSDQVWNNYHNGGICLPFFLNFVPAGKKCISLSASFGKAQLAEWEKDRTKQLLEKYDYISVREKSGLEILNGLGISGAVHLLDPTLMIGAEVWNRMAAKPLYDKGYVLIYQLNANERMDRYADALARKLCLKLIRVGMRLSDLRRPGKVILFPSVEKFISLFKNADYVVTDSFHGTAFSIMFEKQISVFLPPKFSTRIESLLALTGLADRIICSEDSMPESGAINYTPVREILDSERVKAGNFLCRALAGGEPYRGTDGEDRA